MGHLLQLLLPLLPLLPLAFWAWMFVDLLKNNRLLPREKFYWTIAFLFLSVAAALFYFAIEYRKKS